MKFEDKDYNLDGMQTIRIAENETEQLPKDYIDSEKLELRELIGEYNRTEKREKPC